MGVVGRLNMDQRAIDELVSGGKGIALGLGGAFFHDVDQKAPGVVEEGGGLSQPGIPHLTIPPIAPTSASCGTIGVRYWVTGVGTDTI